MPSVPCESCHAGCCRAFAVPVAGADILLVARETERSVWDFLCRWADPEGRIAGRYAPTFHFDDEPATPFVLCLRTDESQTFPGTRKCVFLSEAPEGEAEPASAGSSGLLPVLDSRPSKAWCSIHAHRPGTCRAFPLTLSPELDFAIVNTVPPNGRGDGHPAHDLCPRAWTPDDFDPLDQVRDLVIARYEMQYFHSLARSWNRNPGPWALFPEFLRLVYSSRVQAGGESSHPQGIPDTTSSGERREDHAATIPFPGTRTAQAKASARKVA